MKKIVLLLLVTIFILSCEKDPYKGRVIPEQDLISLLIEIHLADGMIKAGSIPKRFNNNDSAFYHYIFSRHGYSRPLFDTTIWYYSSYKHKEFDKIYDKVLERLSQQEATLIQQSQDKK